LYRPNQFGTMTDEIPSIGLGTWQNKEKEPCERAVEAALDAGYRHIDTAQVYGNERHVGDALAASDVPEDEVFVATKLWNNNLTYDESIKQDDAYIGAKRSLELLGVDAIDLLYVHWPAEDYGEGTLEALDKLYDEGTIRNVGVSNFTPELVREAQRNLDAPLVANQVEMHPLLPQDEMLEFADDAGIDVVAYSPLGRGRALDLPEVQEVAAKHDATPAQVCIAWSMERGAKPIPKSEGPDRIRENYGALDVSLDDEDVEKINDVDTRERLIDPEFAPDW
jgi:2,5-diketo-D-gluconate reductase B